MLVRDFNPQIISLFSYRYKSGKYKFVLNSKLEVKINKNLGNVDFYDQKGKIRLSFREYLIIIYPKYAWDGASPKIKLFNKFIGTPDFKCTIAATCVHDALLQFFHTNCIKLSMKEINLIFKQMILKHKKIFIANIYYYAVEVFGGLFYWFGSLLGRQGSCSYI